MEGPVKIEEDPKVAVPEAKKEPSKKQEAKTKVDEMLKKREQKLEEKK